MNIEVTTTYSTSSTNRTDLHVIRKLRGGKNASPISTENDGMTRHVPARNTVNTANTPPGKASGLDGRRSLYSGAAMTSVVNHAVNNKQMTTEVHQNRG